MYRLIINLAYAFYLDLSFVHVYDFILFFVFGLDSGYQQEFFKLFGGGVQWCYCLFSSFTIKFFILVGMNFSCSCSASSILDGKTKNVPYCTMYLAGGCLSDNTSV